jgi:hypothetical protein
MGAAFTFRAGAGFPGEVTRQENSIIEPCVLNAATPPLFYGTPLIADASTGLLRPFAAGDTALANFYGILVRTFPSSQASATNFGNTPLGGAGVPPTSGPAGLLVSGYIAVQVPVGATAALKNGAVFVWCAASTGAHIQGGFETAASGGNTAAITGSGVTTHFNGPQDANGVIELVFNI